MDAIHDEFARWLKEFDALVRAIDYPGARAYFTEDAMGFGTYGVMLNGREELEREQWMNIWPTIRNFRFRLEHLHCGAAGDLGWLACPWDSEGTRPDGTTFDRPGRATIILRRQDGRWRAQHTHFSLYPTP